MMVMRGKASKALIRAQAEAGALLEGLHVAIASGQKHWFLALLEAIGRWRLPEETVEGRHYRYLIGGPPLPIGEDEFRRLIGGAKYRAHLNYFYGVLVEEALQMTVAEEVEKERLNRVWENGQRLEEEVYLRIYGAPRPELLQRFCQERGLAADGRLSLIEYKEFTYWLFKYRLRACDPARVASDTRKGLARLTRLQATLRPNPSEE